MMADMTRSSLTIAMAAAIGLGTCLPGRALAQTPASASPSIQLGATVFWDYTFTKEPKSKDADGNTISPNAFNVTRTYVNLTGRISDLISFRVTPDITRNADPGSTLNGQLVLRVKYAYASLDLGRWTGKWRNSWIRAGAQPTPYLDYMEGIYRYRFQGPLFAERESFEGASILNSADTGVSFHASFPGNFGDFHAGYYNGEGVTRTEPNNQKALQLRATVRPIAYSTSPVGGRALGVTVFYDADRYQQAAERRRLMLSVTIEHRRLNTGFEFLGGRDQASSFRSAISSRGWSFWVTPFLKERGNGWEGLFRIDRFVPDTNLSAQEKQRVIAGAAYWFPHPGSASTAALLVDVEQVTFTSFPSTPANTRQQRIAVHGLINF